MMDSYQGCKEYKNYETDGKIGSKIKLLQVSDI